MTLSTSLIIIEPCDAETVFRLCLDQLTVGFGGVPTWDYQRQGQVKVWPNGHESTADTSHWSTTCGQGLDAWLFVYHAEPGRALRLADPADVTSVAGVPPCDHHHVRVNWDTAHNTRSSRNEQCGDLHTRLIRSIGEWLDAQGLTWWWQLEETGEWFRGVQNLDELGDHGAAASAWVSNVVLPALGIPSVWPN